MHNAWFPLGCTSLRTEGKNVYCAVEAAVIYIYIYIMKSKQPNNNSLRCNYCWKHRQQDSAVTYQGYFPNAINVEEVRGDVALLFKQYIAKKLLATTRSTSNVLKVFQLVILLFVLIHQSATKCVNYNEGSTVNKISDLPHNSARFHSGRHHSNGFPVRFQVSLFCRMDGYI